MARIRLKDIAEMLDVSVTTVSLVLNGKPVRVSEAKREEIKRIAREQGYRPNLNAKSLVTKTKSIIGVIVPDIENPFFASLCKAIEVELSAYEIVAMILNSEGTMENDKKLIDILYNRDVSGILLVMSEESSTSNSFKAYCESLKIPLVLVDRNFEKTTLPSVTFDNYLGGKLAGEYLLKKGHKDVGCISGPLQIVEARQRYVGFRDVFKSEDVDLYEGTYDYQDGIAGVKSFLENHTISAVFACNDVMAYGAINELNKQKQALEVVGYDKSKSSVMFGYQFPSIFQDVKLLAKHGVVMLQKMSEEKPIESVVLQPVLIEE